MPCWRTGSSRFGPTQLFARLVAACLFLPQGAIDATTIVVQGDCTLPDAVTAAETHSAVGACPAGSLGHDTIELTGDVTLTAIDSHLSQNGPNGLRAIQVGITVEGNGWTIARDESAPEFRIFNNVSGILILRNVRILNGKLTVSDVQVRGGGAIRNGGTLEVVDSTIADSQVIGDGNLALGGGILSSDGTLTVTSSTIRGNSVVTGDTDALGGGISAGGDLLSVQNSTLSGNVVYTNTATARGGGLSTGSSVATIKNATLAGNFTFQTFAHPGDGAALHVGVSSMTTVEGSVLGDSFGPNCSATSSFIDGGGNLSDDASCATVPDSLTGLSGALLNHGGPTATLALLPGSSAIDAAGSCGLATDQRGAPRGASCDAGAFEYGGCPEITLSDDTVLWAETYEYCLVYVGPNYTVAGPHGDLTLRSGHGTVFYDGFSVEVDGTLTVGFDPVLIP